MLRIEVTSHDDWWLREIGFEQQLDAIKVGFEAIRLKIDERERQQKQILDAFVRTP